jgi:hypothetical protein
MSNPRISMVFHFVKFKNCEWTLAMPSNYFSFHTVMFVFAELYQPAARRRPPTSYWIWQPSLILSSHFIGTLRFNVDII